MELTDQLSLFGEEPKKFRPKKEEVNKKPPKKESNDFIPTHIPYKDRVKLSGISTHHNSD